MDLLFKRYASPYLLLEEVIEQQRLVEFINEVYSFKNEEETLKIWLHKVFDKSFNEFKESIKPDLTPSNSKATLEAAIKNSRNMLKGFVPS